MTQSEQWHSKFDRALTLAENIKRNRSTETHWAFELAEIVEWLNEHYGEAEQPASQ